MTKRHVAAVVGLVLTAAAWAASAQAPKPPATTARSVPEYRFDPDWPKPLPAVKDAAGMPRPQWTGGVAWVCVDQRTDRIVTLNRGHVEQMPAGMNAVKSAPVIIRDYAGN